MRKAKLEKKLVAYIERDAEGSHLFFRHIDGRTTVIPSNKEISRGFLGKY